MLQRSFASTAVALTLLAAGPVAVQESGADGATIAAGTLTCKLSDVSNVIIFAEERFHCTYHAANGETVAYRGELSKLGANLSYKNSQVLGWVVIAPASFGGTGVLEGVYFGASVEASVVAGAGARVLVGGSRHQITLQPLSLSGQTGLGAAATLDSLKLTYLPS